MVKLTNEYLADRPASITLMLALGMSRSTAACSGDEEILLVTHDQGASDDAANTRLQCSNDWSLKDLCDVPMF